MTTTAAFVKTVPAHWSARDAASEPGWVARASNMLARWLDASRSRQTLDELDEHMLRDIGLTRDEARREASKFFWQS
jgi:uncharacterized protein YjiS (DUF1127 family)